ncbi:MAG: NAD(P)/FAD-dependent oxidoreductase [Cytophagaceae bacterium]|nr:NAD(P)/FAD-dependent oxidoreductase [Cytophagaceae bacterium]
MKVGIIGGGAAGFFAAINCAEANKEAEITILEKSSKLLSKVKVSGGGRCNVTHACFNNNELIKNYPRGAKELKNAFSVFSTQHTTEWFKQKGVQLKTEEDGRIFPVSNNSQTIIDCFLHEAEKNKIKILLNSPVLRIKKENDKFILYVSDKELLFDKVLIAAGGYSKADSYDWIKGFDHEIISPVPSLFTFNIPQSKFEGLQGIAIEKGSVKILGSKAEQSGPVLITHWGLSGPCILRLSAWEARAFHSSNYHFKAFINWIPEFNEEKLREVFIKYKSEHPKKFVVSNPLFNLPRRLWERITEIATIEYGIKWGDMPNKKINKLLEELIRNSIEVKGKTTFKEEFVTCGGVSLKDVDFSTMESKKCKGLYFAGEILDIDGITGGFNFQAAWTTGYIAGKAMAV